VEGEGAEGVRRGRQVSAAKYRRLRVGEIVRKGDRYMDPWGEEFPTTRPGERVGEHEVYHRRIKPRAYRYLRKGETVRNGDEFLQGLHGVTYWAKANMVGHQLDKYDKGQYRRRVKKTK
jgi:hypothetical protein